MTDKKEESSSDWQNFKNEIVMEFKNKPIFSTISYTLIVFYIVGFFYNNLNNNNDLFTSSWFYDAIILSWTNLFIVPIVLIQLPWKGKPRNWQETKDLLTIHLFSPLVWIFGYLGFRFLIKVLSSASILIDAVLNWLAT
jgi:hypothetical protein